MDSIVFRVEWKDSGPFWNSSIQRDIMKHCMRVKLPANVRMRNGDDNFLNYYIANAPCPYDNPKMDNYLCLAPVGTYQFGFNSKDCMMDQLGLYKELFLLQFQELFNTGFFSVKTYLVEWIDYNEAETMFIAKSKQLIDQVFTWDDFVNELN